MNFLIIEDDIFLSSKLRSLFDKRENTNIVSVINTYFEFLNEISVISIYDVILLDINLWNNNKSWIDIIEIIRKKTINIPIIIVSWIDDISNIKLAFHLWASDYIIKPFRFEELEIRVLKWFKHSFIKSNNNFNNNFSYNWLIYNIDNNEFIYKWSIIRLSKKNKYLLSIFLSNNEKFLSINYIEDKIFWNLDNFKSRNIRVYIYRLRTSLRLLSIDWWIKNIRWEWYIFKK
jgi:DNA-binding response OmpR family regulator